MYSLLPCHTKLNKKFLIFSRVPFGMWDKVIQHTEMVSSTNLTNTNHPSLDNHLLQHSEIHFSTFLDGYFQSYFVYLLGFNISPRYFIPSLISRVWKGRNLLATKIISSSTWYIYIADFLILNSIPVAFLYRRRISLNASSSLSNNK